ncbi:type II toxin-antitoxin system SpoIISB family antitoxin [Bacillus safensis]
MKKKIKQLRYVQFAKYQPSPYTKRLIEKSETAIQSYKQKHSLI